MKKSMQMLWMCTLFMIILTNQILLACRCGYGGLCLDHESAPCECDKISKGFYESDCRSLVNHCSPDICHTGICIPTLGSYFCQCPENYHGQNCSIFDNSFDKNIVDQEVYAFHQVQPTPLRNPYFIVVYDPKKKNEFINSHKISITLKIEISDGRVYRPNRDSGMKIINVKLMCLKETDEYPDALDREVCNFLPDRDVWSFQLSTSLSNPMSDDEGTLYIPGLKSVVGRVGKVSISIILKNYTGTAEISTTIYHSEHTIFNYYLSKVPGNCMIEFAFDGCSASHRYPLQHLRGSAINIHPIIRVMNCTGVLRAGKFWSLQENIDKDDGDPVPHSLGDRAKLSKLSFPLRFFSEGTHMIEFNILLRGTPPYYGGSEIFSKAGQCWIRIIMGPPLTRIKFGNKLTSSCHASLLFRLFSENPSYAFSDLRFIVSCNQTTDPECKSQHLTVPVFSKVKSACNVYYHFSIKVLTNIKSSVDEDVEIVDAVVFFTESETTMHFTCLSNCYPIDPNHRVIVYASSIPYFGTRVSWRVSRDLEVIRERDGDIITFFPKTASRIIRINGYRFVTPGKIISQVQFNVTGTRSYVQRSTYSINLVPYAMNFTIEPVEAGGSLYRFALKGDRQPYNHKPVSFRVYQMNDYTRSCIPLITTNYEEKLVFQPAWSRIKLCISDSVDAEACSVDAEIDTAPIDTVNNLNPSNVIQLKKSGDMSSTLFAVVQYLFNSMKNKDHPDKPMKWSISMETRIIILEGIFKAKITRPLHLFICAHIVSMMFYSEEGNLAQKLHPFVNELNENSSYETMLTWMRMRSAAVKIYEKVNKIFAEKYATLKKLRKYGYGDVLDELFHVWSLSHVQQSFVRRFERGMKSKDKDYLFAELDCQERSIVRHVVKGLNYFMRSLGINTKLYYGMRTIGVSDTRGWVIKDSYRGILYGIDRNVPHFENLPGHSSFLFGYNDTKPQLWLDRTELLLPKSVGHEMDSYELALVVLIAKNRPADFSVTPFLFLSLMRKNGAMIKRMPKDYLVTLPVMQSGQLVTDTTIRLISTVLEKPLNDTRSSKYRHFSVYKISLPTQYPIWRELLYIENAVPLKAKASFTNAPSYEEVLSEPNMEFKWNLDVKMYRGETLLNASAHGLSALPMQFYIGMLLSEEVAPGTRVVLYRTKSVTICKVVDTKNSDNIESCKGSENGTVLLISCWCRLFGIVLTVPQDIWRVRIWMDTIQLTLPIDKDHNEAEIFPAALAVLILIAVVLAIVFDKKRQKVDLIYLEDTYPGDQNIIIIGIYTSMRFLAGTNSTVAMKVIGTYSSSRVHLMRTRLTKVLKRGRDDWFVMATQRPLGKVISVSLWHNFHHLSDWCCSQILIYDTASTNWFHIDVKRWFKIYPSIDYSKMASLKAEEMESVDGVFLHLPYEFSTHYINEIINSHFLISVFFLRDRSLTSIEQRVIIGVVRILSLCLTSWFVEKYVISWTYHKDLDPEASREVLFSLGLDTIAFAFFAVLLCIPFTLPLRLSYRSSFKSRLLQKKVTNPIYLQLVKAEELVTERKPDITAPPKVQEAPPIVKKVGFRTDDTDEQPFRRVTRILSNVIQRRIAWTKRAAGQGWKRALLILSGPAQFRCVNIKAEIFIIKTRRRMLKIRIFAGFEILLLLGAMYLIIETVNVWADLPMIAFLYLLAISLDLIIFDPVLIALNSVWMYYCLKVTNKESYLWNEDVKIRPPVPLDYATYVKTATSKEYKPLLSYEIKGKMKTQKKITTWKAAYFFTISLLAVLCCGMMLDHEYDNHYYYCVRALLLPLLEPTLKLSRPSHSIEDVNYPPKVVDYIATSVAYAPTKWYNQETNIDRRGDRWAKDLVSKPIGASNMIIISLSPIQPTPYLHSIVEPYFTSASEYIPEAEIQKNDIYLGGFQLKYMNHSYGTVAGRSREYYQMRGHNITMAYSTYGKFYSSLIKVLGDLLEFYHLYNPRALIYTKNYINAYARRISTVDVVIEFLPSGVSSAKLHVHSFKAYHDVEDFARNYFQILALLVICHFIHALIEAVKYERGIKAYFWTINGKLKLIVYPSTILLWFSNMLHVDEAALEDIVDLPDYAYTDLHKVYNTALYEAVLLLIILNALVIDTFFAIWIAHGSERLKQAMSSKCVHCCLTIFLVQLYLFLDVNVCANLFDRKIALIEILLFIKEIGDIENIYNHWILLGSFFILFIFQRTSTAVFLANYFDLESSHYEETSLARAIKTMYRIPQSLSSEEEMNLMFSLTPKENVEKYTNSPESDSSRIRKNSAKYKFISGKKEWKL